MPYYPENPPMYGATASIPPEMQGKFAPMAGIMRGVRRRSSLGSMATALAVPWLLFLVASTVMSFTLHYQKPEVCYMILSLEMVLVLFFGYYAFDAYRKRDLGRDHTWLTFVFATGVMAVISGGTTGNVNFFKNMQPFYDIQNLATYKAIDPGAARGQQLMDAGRIHFKLNTYLDLGHAMAFKNLDTYCVAPIAPVDANGTAMPLASYDFWAVGTNCCDEGHGFRCGEYKNPKARSGLRLMRDDLRPFYRLAVQQAEAAYNIKAVHPLFMYWMQDTTDEVSSFEDDGLKYFIMGLLSFFSLQTFLVIAASLTFMKSA